MFNWHVSKFSCVKFQTNQTSCCWIIAIYLEVHFFRTESYEPCLGGTKTLTCTFRNPIIPALITAWSAPVTIWSDYRKTNVILGVAIDISCPSQWIWYSLVKNAPRNLVESSITQLRIDGFCWNLVHECTVETLEHLTCCFSVYQLRVCIAAY